LCGYDHLHLTDLTDSNSKFCFSSNICKNNLHVDNFQFVKGNGLSSIRQHSDTIGVFNGFDLNHNADFCFDSGVLKNKLNLKHNVQEISRDFHQLDNEFSCVTLGDQSTGSFIHEFKTDISCDDFNATEVVNKIESFSCHSTSVIFGDNDKVNSISLLGGQSTGSSFHDNFFNSGQLARLHTDDLVHVNDIYNALQLQSFDCLDNMDSSTGQYANTIDSNYTDCTDYNKESVDFCTNCTVSHPNPLTEGLDVCLLNEVNCVGMRDNVPCIYNGSDHSVSSQVDANYLGQLNVNNRNFNLNRFGNGDVCFDYLDFDHVISCQVIDCKMCSYIRCSFITFIHNSLGFIPHSSFHSISSVGRGEGVFQIVSNISSYLNIQQYFKGIPNFISKIALWPPILILQFLGNYFRDSMILRSLI
jgi:hypothetical protein